MTSPSSTAEFDIAVTSNDKKVPLEEEETAALILHVTASQSGAVKNETTERLKEAREAKASATMRHNNAVAARARAEEAYYLLVKSANDKSAAKANAKKEGRLAAWALAPFL